MQIENALREALSEDGDLELRFLGGQSMPVHSLKLKLASSVLKALLNDVMDCQIASAAKRRKLLEASSCLCEEAMPSLQVGVGTVYVLLTGQSPLAHSIIERPVHHTPCMHTSVPGPILDRCLDRYPLCTCSHRW